MYFSSFNGAYKICTAVHSGHTHFVNIIAELELKNNHNTMKLWTIQPLEIYDLICSESIITNSKDFIQSDFKQAYDWMILQMEKRIGNRPFKKSYPFWAWYQYASQKKKRPDLRNSCLLEKGTEGVRIEFDKPDNQVLLSDFNLWHCVLNYWHIPNNEEESLGFDRLLEVNKIEFVNKERYTSEIRKIVEESWSKIFDMNYEKEYSANRFEEKSIQATFWSLNKEEITRVDYFKAR